MIREIAAIAVGVMIVHRTYKRAVVVTSIGEKLRQMRFTMRSCQEVMLTLPKGEMRDTGLRKMSEDIGKIDVVLKDGSYKGTVESVRLLAEISEEGVQ